ncbi:MAG TPA: TlpA disulfide reductase family protein [Chitinophagaceae bacterium]|nr:TlpA disulfide reductase family protein [Chitinophagaceae bacterium]
MKKILAAVLLLVGSNAIGQDIPLLDTTMKKAMSEKGYVDTKIAFRDFSGNTTDGRIYTQDSLKNKVTFVNFWFEHCAPCVAEFDALNKLYNKYKNNPGFRFISITFEKPEDIKRIVKEQHLDFPIIILEREKIYPLIFQLGFPTTIIVDQTGKISYIKTGGPVEKKLAQQQVDLVFSKQIDRLLFPQ